DRHQIVRILRTVRGSVRFALECAPRFDYGRQDHVLEVTDAGAVFKAADATVTIHTPITLERIGGDVRGEVTLSEGQTSAAVLEDREGYRGSRPVRIGNGAADQLQLDIYGEMMDSVYHAHLRGLRVGHRGWTHLRQIMDWLATNWDRPEEGIWETRGGRQDFT